MHHHRLTLGVTAIGIAVSLLALPTLGSFISDDETNTQTEIKTTSLQEFFPETIAKDNAALPTTDQNCEQNNCSKNKQTSIPKIESSQLVHALTNLPAAEAVDFHPALEEKGTAILFLQRHKSPGSATLDQVNDLAVVVQEEIAQAIESLHDAFGINHILVEGKLDGSPYHGILDNELKQARRDTAQLASLEKILQSLQTDERIPASFRSELAIRGQTFLDEQNRSLLLDGAALFSYAHGTDLELYGAERPETYKKSARIVVEYMQLTNRLSALNPTRGSTALVRQLLSERNGELIELSDILRLKQALNGKIGPAESGSASTSLTLVLQEVEQVSTVASVDENAREATELIAGLLAEPAAAVASVPDGADNKNASATLPANPYADSFDREALSERLSEINAAMNETVVAERNSDAAELFIEMLASEQISVGMIQFGAQHGAGLVKELRARGISVVVVTPTSLR